MKSLALILVVTLILPISGFSECLIFNPDTIPFEEFPDLGTTYSVGSLSVFNPTDDTIFVDSATVTYDTTVFVNWELWISGEFDIVGEEAGSNAVRRGPLIFPPNDSVIFSDMALDGDTRADYGDSIFLFEFSLIQRSGDECPFYMYAETKTGISVRPIDRRLELKGEGDRYDARGRNLQPDKNKKFKGKVFIHNPDKP